jgi:hypothetical protein
MSLAAVPVYVVAAAFHGTTSHGGLAGRWLWAARVLTAGLAFLITLLVVAVISDDLTPGTGDAVMVALGLGTLLLAFAATAYDHVPAAALLITSFLLIRRRRPVAAGLAAGLAVLVEYQSGVTFVILLVATAVVSGRSAARFVAGGVLPLAALGAYDWAAFGAPWRNPLAFSDNRYQAAQNSGLVGIHAPSLHAVRLVLVGDKGLLVLSPVLVLAAIGLWLLWREGRRVDAAVCAAVTLVYLFAEFGYFDPYGGFSPGPRYVVPALPFLILGLGPAFARWPRLTWTLTAASVVATLATMLTWTLGADSYGGAVWRPLIQLLTRGSGPLRADLTPSVLPFPAAHSPGLEAVVAVVAAGAACVIVALARPARAGRSVPSPT